MLQFAPLACGERLGMPLHSLRFLSLYAELANKDFEILAATSIRNQKSLIKNLK